jgi:hypothetical protein
MTDIYNAAVQKLAKWRAVLAGWQLGTRAKGDPESDAVRDHRECTLLLRSEVTALVRLGVERGLFSVEDFTRVNAEEAEHLSAAYERRFPGMRATEIGIEYYDMDKVRATTQGWRP